MTDKTSEPKAELEIDKQTRVQTEDEITKQFSEEYNELCRTYNRIIQVEPAFVQRDDRTYSVVIKTKVAVKR